MLKGFQIRRLNYKIIEIGMSHQSPILIALC